MVNLIVACRFPSNIFPKETNADTRLYLKDVALFCLSTNSRIVQ